MTPVAIRRMAALLVLGLVITSLPARVWLFGACPVCGQFHEKILVAHLGGDPTPDSDPTDDPPTHPDEDHAVDGCFPPLPFCPTVPVDLHAVALAASDEVSPLADPHLTSVPAAALIRPPRA